MAIVDIGEHMVIDPEIMHGRLTFRDTRVPVSMLFEMLTMDAVMDEMQKHWPHVSRAAMTEALAMASAALHQRYARELDAADDEARRIWDAAFGDTTTQEKREARRGRVNGIRAESAGS